MMNTSATDYAIMLKDMNALDVQFVPTPLKPYKSPRKLESWELDDESTEEVPPSPVQRSPMYVTLKPRTPVKDLFYDPDETLSTEDDEGVQGAQDAQKPELKVTSSTPVSEPILPVSTDNESTESSSTNEIIEEEKQQQRVVTKPVVMKNEPIVTEKRKIGRCTNNSVAALVFANDNEMVEYVFVTPKRKKSYSSRESWTSKSSLRTKTINKKLLF